MSKQATPVPDHGEDRTAAQSLALGDSAFVDEDYEEALNLYTAASISGSSTKSTHLMVRFRVHSHRAAVLILLERYSEAATDTSTALDLIPVSGLNSTEIEVCWRRQGIAKFHLESYVGAASSFGKALQLATLNKQERSFDYGGWIQNCQKAQTPIVAQASPAVPSAKAVTVAQPSPKEPSVGAPPPAAATATTAPSPVEKPKYQYYQNDTTMTICVLEPNVNRSDLQVDFVDQTLTIKLVKRGHEFTVLGGPLCEDADQCRVVVRQEKVLIKLRKSTPNVEWNDLLDMKKKRNKSSTAATGTADAPAAAAPAEVPAPTVAKKTKAEAPVVPRPYASHKDWDSIERQLKEDEEKEKPEGDEAMNKLFQQIYANADEDTRRAMVKSYQTSGGTVLSTNWNEVKEKDYEKERTAPKDMEWKTWEGDKLPMKEDD